jgi:Domain of Unknown Function (DUF1206)
MTQPAVHAGRIADEAVTRVRQASPWITALGRLGLACKGVVYVLIGTLAVQAALGRGGATTDAKGALTQVLNAPFGKLLLGLIAIGLAGYVLWRCVQAFMDTDRKGTDTKGLVARAGYLISAIIYTTLALAALRLLQGVSDGRNGDQATQDWTAKLFEQPFGQALVVVVGLVVLGSAAMQAYRAYTADFRKELAMGEMSGETQTWAERAGRMGHAARGVTLGIVGLFLVVAALRQQPEEARGLAGAMAALVDQPYGPLLLALVAVGLAAYGLYEFVEARYRRMVV